MLALVWRILAIALAFAGVAGAQLQRVANTSLNLPAELPASSVFTTENALGSLTFSSPIGLASPPGESGRLFVLQRGGTIRLVTFPNGVPTASTYLSLPTIFPAGETLRTDGENGALSMAFHPHFATNGQIFVFYSFQVTENAVNKLFQRVAKVTVEDPAANVAVSPVLTPLISQVHRAGNHNAGDIAFGADGYLYVSTGDEGGSNDTYNNARFINKSFFGAILRIDVDQRPGSLPPNFHSQAALSSTFPSAVHAGSYRVPPDNPFIGRTSWHNVAISPSTVRTEIWATGLRNPWRMAFDPVTGRLFVADVGQNAREEVNIVKAGDDLGWSWREGFAPFTSGPSPTTPPSVGFDPVDPIHDYGRTMGTSITGGEVYRGNRLTELYGAYLFADYNSGRIWALRPGAAGWDSTLLATDDRIVEFGVDPRNGDVIFCDLADGRVKRLARSGTSGTFPPATLSQTGAFANLATLAPEPGMVPYEPNVSFWSDHASKRRWFAIQNMTDTIGFSRDGNWNFPRGMIWVKHFDIELTRGDPATRRKLETRFLVKTASESYGLVYRWRADQSDADLVPEEGLSETFSVEVGGSPVTQTWRFPARNECRACHTPEGGHALGFNTRQLNRMSEFMPGTTANQLEALESAGYLTGPLPPHLAALPAFASVDDTTQSLEWRVRSYLEVNCAQCHQPGAGTQGGWDARSSVPLDSAHIINGNLNNSGGNPAERLVVPGSVANSMLPKRLSGIGGGRMPPIATHERDFAAEQLVADWITQSLPGRRSFAEWQLFHFGSTSGPGTAPGDDPDGDGRSNHLEYLTGTDPNDGGSSWAPDAFSLAGADAVFQFLQPANRSVLVESSTNLVDWTLWDVPGNLVGFPAEAEQRRLSAPAAGANRFFRLKVAAP
jgi:glucose/arabinose dehydrogenase